MLSSYHMDCGPWSLQLGVKTHLLCLSTLCSTKFPPSLTTWISIDTHCMHLLCVQVHQRPAAATALHWANLPSAKCFHTHSLPLAPGQKCIALNEMWDKPVCGIIIAAVAFSWTVFVSVCMQQGYRTSPPGSLSHGDSFNKGRPKDKSESTQPCKKKVGLRNNKLLLLFLLWCLLPWCFYAVVMDEVNNELLMMITANKSQPPTRKFRVERSSGSQVPLTFDSNPEQVTAWLNAKGFSKP